MRKIVFYIIVSILVSSCSLSAPGHKGKKTDHFDGTHFHNIAPYEKKTFWDIMKWRLFRSDANWPKQIENKSYPAPKQQFNKPGRVSVTFVNHATVLIQADGLNILTDPIWSERASPFTWIGPKRVREPGIAFDTLPPIDVVMISHNHYDHLDLATLKRLQKKFNPLFLVGLGNEKLLKKHGIDRVKALDWWQGIDVKGKEFMFVPAQHFSGRGLTDRMKTLWGGYVVQSSAGPIYFAGDTAWGPHFSMIEQRFGPMFLSLLPIGAYEPRDLMRISHINPTEAVKAMQVLHSKYAVGIHFDTFDGLTNETYQQPQHDLKKALKATKIENHRFYVLDFGQSHTF